MALRLDQRHSDFYCRVVGLIARRECQKPTPRTRGLEHEDNTQVQLRLVVVTPKNIANHGKQEAGEDVLAMTVGLDGADLARTGTFIDGVTLSCADAIIETFEIANARIVKTRILPIPNAPWSWRRSCQHAAGNRAPSQRLKNRDAKSLAWTVAPN